MAEVQNPRDASQLTRAYLDSICIEMRHLDGVIPDTSLQLYGHTFRTPVMTAAFSHMANTHPGGMPEMARGALSAGALNWAGMGDEAELEAILATGAPTVKIVKPYADREQVFRRLRHVWQSGAVAVGMDIDHSFGANGLPDHVCGEDMLPVSQEELKRFVSATPLPFIVKGVLSVQDALKCRSCGVSGILVSHHHGLIPYALPPLRVLPRIVEAVGRDMDVFVDCGMDTGADAFKALALGAKAVCVGRAVLPAFHEKGAAGVAAHIEGMTSELRGIMARTASPSIHQIDPGVLWF